MYRPTFRARRACRLRLLSSFMTLMYPRRMRVLSTQVGRLAIAAVRFQSPHLLLTRSALLPTLFPRFRLLEPDPFFHDLVSASLSVPGASLATSVDASRTTGHRSGSISVASSTAPAVSASSTSFTSVSTFAEASQSTSNYTNAASAARPEPEPLLHDLDLSMPVQSTLVSRSLDAPRVDNRALQSVLDCSLLPNNSSSNTGPSLPPGISSTTTYGAIGASELTERIGIDERDDVEALGQAFDQIAMDDWEDEDFLDADEDHEDVAGGAQDSALGTTDGPSLQDAPSVATDAPPTAVAANDLPSDEDPFRYSPSAARPQRSSHGSHPNLAVYLVYLLVLWLHTQFHLPFRACNVVLVVVGLVLRAAGVAVDPPMYTSLPGVISELDAEPQFQTLPVCPKCLEVHPLTEDKNATCLKCEQPLYKTDPTPRQQRRGRTIHDNPKPFLAFPHMSLEEQLGPVIAAMEDQLDSWRTRSRVPGEWTDIFDGNICKQLPGPDGLPFFRPDLKVMPNGELRIGVTLGVDWFSYIRSQIAPSHTSGPMSFSLINLLPHLRYRTSNLLLFGLIPGPKEPNPDQLQYYMRVLVNELLRLWKFGFKVITRRYPNGRLARLALVGVICDKPAAHKMGGFGSHSHRFFCTRCWIEQMHKATTASFTKNGFRARTDKEHRKHMEDYLKCKTKAARDEFVKQYATRWCELARLPYFDMCRMIVVDPMHNLFLGVVKTHFYHIWVQLNILRKTKELRRFHAMLAELYLPAKLGRLPSLIGEPAGGSLTADQWRVLAVTVGPLIIPQLWQEFLPEDTEIVIAQRQEMIAKTVADKKAAAAAARKIALLKKKSADSHVVMGDSITANPRPQRTRKPTERAKDMDIDPENDNGQDDGAIEDDADDYEAVDLASNATNSRKRRRKTTDDDATNANIPCNLHPRDPGNFLKLGAALKILLSDKLTESDLDEADRLLRAYCLELIELYGPSVIKPNHHYATHTPEFVRDYGPLKEFWTFLFERMNKVLKSYNSGNHGGGELECSFFREFHRTVQTSRLLSEGSRAPEKSELRMTVDAMYRASNDDRGTVQALARELDQAREDDGTTFELSPRSEKSVIPSDLYFAFLIYLQTRLPQLRLRSHIALSSDPSSVAIHNTAEFFDYVVVHQHRYRASSRAASNADSLVAVRTSDTSLWVGELRDIVVFRQEQVGVHRFGRMKWYRPFASGETSAAIWAQFASLDVQLWQSDTYLAADDPGPDTFIQLESIVSHVVKRNVTIAGISCWATVMLERVSR